MKCAICKKEKDYVELWHITGKDAPSNLLGKYICDSCEKKVTVKNE